MKSDLHLPRFDSRGVGQWKGLLGWILLCFAAAAVGAVASAGAQDFYLNLNRPSWAPPASVFGPVWTVLYAMMAVAAWMVWKVRGFRAAPRTLGLFLAQLAANALWSWLFFKWQLGLAALVEVLLLWALILATTIAFWRVRPLAGMLLLPYLAWVGFASALTWACWRLNPGVLG
jgi:tryptophan-rich sensory protein